MHSRRDPTAIIPNGWRSRTYRWSAACTWFGNPTLRAASAGPRVSRQYGIAGEVASQDPFPGRPAHLPPQDPADLGRGTGRVLLLERHGHLQQLTGQRQTGLPRPGLLRTRFAGLDCRGPASNPPRARIHRSRVLPRDPHPAPAGRCARRRQARGPPAPARVDNEDRPPPGSLIAEQPDLPHPRRPRPCFVVPDRSHPHR